MSDETTRTHVPIPRGGFQTNEVEARWLEETIILRAKEGLATMGLPSANVIPTGLYDLLLLSLNHATARGAKVASPLRPQFRTNYRNSGGASV